jgi:hypothetical protein
MNRFKAVLVLAAVCAAVGTPVAARGPAASTQAAAAPGARPTPPPYSTKVDVVIERYQGDKKIASMPFMVRTTNGTGSVRVGVDVPIGSTTQTKGSSGPGTNRSDTTSVPEYRNVGTSIDAWVAAQGDDGRYEVRVTVSDASIYDPDAARRAALVARGLAPARPAQSLEASAFHTFTSQNSLRLRDGETAEFVSATDKITGDIVRVMVTLNIVK